MEPRPRLHLNPLPPNPSHLPATRRAGLGRGKAIRVRMTVVETAATPLDEERRQPTEGRSPVRLSRTRDREDRVEKSPGIAVVRSRHGIRRCLGKSGNCRLSVHQRPKSSIRLDEKSCMLTDHSFCFLMTSLVLPLVLLFNS